MFSGVILVEFKKVVLLLKVMLYIMFDNCIILDLVVM